MNTRTISKILSMIGTTSFLLFFALPSHGKAQTIYGEDTLGYIKFVHTRIDDQVTDNCWTNAKSIEARVRLIFEQSDISTVDELPAFLTVVTPIVSISALGFRTNNGTCAVNATLKVIHRGYTELGDSDRGVSYYFQGLVHSFSRFAIFTSGSNTNSQLADFFETSASELAIKVLSGRRNLDVENFFDMNPNYLEEPMTQEEFEEYLKKLDV